MSEPLRILVVDDTRSIHDDFRKILQPAASPTQALAPLRSALFEEPAPPAAATAPGGSTAPPIELRFAHQGQEALELCRAACERGAPFALAFVDMRMPPGWDGVRTIQELWRVDPRLEVVISTAFSDRPFEEIARELGNSERFLILKKPFDGVEIAQLARGLGAKWQLARALDARIEGLSSEVAAHARQLEAKVAELERSNRDLAEASLRAAAAARARSEFLATVSHELRTPLTAILGFAELAAHETRSTDAREHLAVVQSNGQHLLTLINDLLDQSKIDAGALKTERIVFAPRALVEEVGCLLGSRAGQKGLSLELELEPRLPDRCLGDPTRVRQILVNLVGNAIKFTERGTIVVQLGVGPEVGGARRLVWTVRDTGIGISPEALTRLFRPFAQADSSTARRFGGTGLGLSISRRLAELLGGELTVTSVLGQGSTFRLELPLEEAQFEPESVPTLVGDHGELGLHGVRILLVDDGRDNQRLVQLVLGRAGATIECAGDGLAGVEAVLRARADGLPFDLVLMDVMMPVLDGPAATRQLRAAGITTPIVALTAQEGARALCQDAGCDEYLTKPLDRLKLLSRCHALTSGRLHAPR